MAMVIHTIVFCHGCLTTSRSQGSTQPDSDWKWSEFVYSTAQICFLFVSNMKLTYKHLLPLSLGTFSHTQYDILYHSFHLRCYLSLSIVTKIVSYRFSCSLSLIRSFTYVYMILFPVLILLLRVFYLFFLPPPPCCMWFSTRSVGG